MSQLDKLSELKALVMERNADKENGLLTTYAELYGMVSMFLTEMEIDALIQLVKDLKKS